MHPRLLIATVATALVAAAGLVLTASGFPAANTDPGGQGCDPPPQLETIRGSLERSGDGHVVAGDPVDFGAEWYLQRTTAPTDYDGDDLRPGPPPWAGGPDCDRVHPGPLPGVGPPR